MVIELKKPITKAKLEKAQRSLQKRKKKQGFNSDLFLGKIKWGEDGLTIQRMMRDEWL